MSEGLALLRMIVIVVLISLNSFFIRQEIKHSTENEVKVICLAHKDVPAVQADPLCVVNK